MKASETVRGSWDLFVSPLHLDELLDGFPVPVGAVMSASQPDPAGGQIDWITSRYLTAVQTIAQADRPLVLAGDCLSSLATVAGLQRRNRDVSVIWLDAHGDFNTPAISTSGYLAGMSLAMLTGRAFELIGQPIGLRPVPDERVVLVDARDLDPAERDLLDASRIRRVAADPRAVRDATAELSASDIYVHLDVDIIDSRQVPGLRWDAGAGPSLSTIEDCLTDIVDVAPPVAACIACPWPSHLIAQASTRDVVSRLAAAIGAELRWTADRTASST
jgi:arginase